MTIDYAMVNRKNLLDSVRSMQCQCNILVFDVLLMHLYLFLCLFVLLLDGGLPEVRHGGGGGEGVGCVQGRALRVVGLHGVVKQLVVLKNNILQGFIGLVWVVTLKQN